jgi:hypothetical protein
MVEEQQQTQASVLTEDLEKGSGGGALSHTVTISAELYEKVIPYDVKFANLVALPQSQEHRHGRPSSTIRKSCSSWIIGVATFNIWLTLVLSLRLDPFLPFSLAGMAPQVSPLLRFSPHNCHP